MSDNPVALLPPSLSCPAQLLGGTVGSPAAAVPGNRANMFTFSGPRGVQVRGLLDDDDVAAALQGGGGVDAARTAIDGLVSYEPEEELKVGARIWSIYRESI